MDSAGKGPDLPVVTENDAGAQLDDWGDPEIRLLRQEEAAEAEAEDEARPDMGIFQRLDVLLADFSSAERQVFWHVFVDGMSIAAAAREVDMAGNVHLKFKKMLAAAKEVLGDAVGE
jgi:hypothetical protein